MIPCQECVLELDFEEDELDVGDVLPCSECGSEFEVVSVEPLELQKVSDDDEGEEDEE